MKRLFASRRRRRRMFLLALVVAIGAAVASLVVWVGDTGDRREVFTNEPPTVYEEPKAIRYSKRELGQIHATAVKFIETAVAREHIADSWDITHPELRVGYTRETWAAGDIPAVPYKAETPDAAPWRVAWSYKDDVALFIALLPQRGTKLRSMAFSVELKAVGRGDGRRWLVSSWVPLSSGSAEAVQTAQEQKAREQGPPPAPIRAPLGTIWLIVPLALLGAILLIPIAIGVRGWIRGIRARRAYPSTRSPFDP